jgi:hypothetical protein
LPSIAVEWWADFKSASLFSETKLFNEIKELFPDEVIIQHGKPSWLGQQHLDIFFPKRNIGIEYQGQQHLEPVDYFGGEKGFKELQERDMRKKKLCEENSCELIYVYSEYDIREIKKEIKSVIEYS